MNHQILSSLRQSFFNRFAYCIAVVLVSCLVPLAAQYTTTTTTTSGATSDGGSNYSSSKVPCMEIGFRYMPTFTSFEIVSESNSSIQPSFTVGHGFGAFLAYNMSNTIAFQGEIIYSSIAQKYSANGGDNTITLNYINIPLLFSLNSDKSAPLNFNFVIGPQIGINVGSSLAATGNGNGTSTVTGVVAVKAADLGFAYGGGLDFGSSSWRYNIGFRGVYGLLDISDKHTNAPVDQYYVLNSTHVKTYAGYLGVSYMF